MPEIFAPKRKLPAAGYDARSNFASLNGLRFLAALSIVVFHYMPLTQGTSLSALVLCSPAAVGFFFLLSGFVLAHRHPSVPSKPQFWWARFVRVYPMYLLAFLLFIPIALLKYQGSPHYSLPLAAGINLLMVQAWTPLSQSWNGPSWSLSVEAFLYAMFPFLVTQVGRVRNRLIWCCVALLPAGLTILLCLDVVPAQIWRSWIGNNPIFWVPVFCLGICLGLWRSASANVPRSMDIPVALVLAAMVTAALFWPPRFREVFINGGAVPLFAAAVVLCTYPTKVMGKILGNPLMDRLGKASYITYIVQAPLWHYFHAAVNRVQHRPLADRRTGMAEFVAFVVFLLFCSLFLDRAVDEPLRRRLQKLSRKSRPKPVAVVEMPQVNPPIF